MNEVAIRLHVKADAHRGTAMTPETIAITTIGIALAGLMIHFTTTMNRRFDDINRRFDDMNRSVNHRFDDLNRRFDDAARQNEAAHARLDANISELRADFRALTSRPAAEGDQTT